MKTLDVVLVIVAILIVTFIIAMTVIFCVKGSIPDTLVTCVLGTGSAELIASALITIVKRKYKFKENEDEAIE